MKNVYTAVLFDFDGVLGRTLEDNYAAWAHALAKHGMTIGEEEYYLIEGAPPVQVALAMLQKHGRDARHAPDIAAEKDRYYRTHHSFSFYDGAPALVVRLRQSGLKVALVSGAARARLLATCGDEFLGHFDAVVTSEDVRRGKPDPEPYLRAAERLAVEPKHCLVVENAPLGIHSAKSAGMDCVAVTSTLDERFLSEADVVISSLGDLGGVVSSLRLDGLGPS